MAAPMTRATHTALLAAHDNLQTEVARILRDCPAEAQGERVARMIFDFEAAIDNIANGERPLTMAERRRERLEREERYPAPYTVTDEEGRQHRVISLGWMPRETFFDRPGMEERMREFNEKVLRARQEREERERRQA
jgi:hypothetical protein